MCPTELKEIILAHGHENILATHRTTFEITKEADLSKRGNCVIAVSADKAIDDLGFKFKESMRKKDAKIAILIRAGGATETVNASGSQRLVLTHANDIVVRKSDYVCKRTLAIQADKAAYELSRRLVEKLKSPTQNVQITLKVKTH